MPPKDFLKKLLKQCLLSWKSCCCYFFIISLIVDMKDHGTYWWWTLCVFSQLWWRCLYRDPLRDLNNIPRKWLMKSSHFSQSWYFVFILPCMLTCNCLLMFWNGRLMVFLCFLHTLFEKTFYQCNCCGFIESNIYHWIDCTIKCSGLTVCIFQYYRSNALYFWSVAIIMRWICLSTSIGKIF